MGEAWLGISCVTKPGSQGRRPARALSLQAVSVPHLLQEGPRQAQESRASELSSWPLALQAYSARPQQPTIY